MMNEKGNRERLVGLGAFLVVFFFIFSACAHEDVPEIPKSEALVITQLPAQSEYVAGEELDLDGLVVALLVDGQSSVIEDYDVEPFDESTPGVKEIKIDYGTLTATFTVRYQDLDSCLLAKVVTGVSPSIVTESDEIGRLQDVKNGGTRKTNEVVHYDASHNQSRNVYGYELAFDRFGLLVASATLVDLPEGGFIISAHGTMVAEIKKIPTDAIAYYDAFSHEVTFYRSARYTALYPRECQYDEARTRTLASLDARFSRSLLTTLNALTASFNRMASAGSVSEEEDELFTSLLAELPPVAEEEAVIRQATISYQEITLADVSAFDILPQRDNSRFVAQKTDVTSGGFRGTDQMVHYDSTNLRTRNAYGYEFAVDAQGMVCEIATLVSLPEGGFIISGHGTSADWIKSLICMGDFVTYDAEAGTISVYRDSRYAMLLDLHRARASCYATLQEALDQAQALDAVTIAQDLARLTEDYDVLLDLYARVMSPNLAERMEFDERQAEAKGLCDEIAFLTIEEHPVEVKSFWHYPFSLAEHPEDSLQGVDSFLDFVQSLGFNEILVDIHSGGYVVYESDSFNILPKLLSCDYGEYGHDYLKCLVGEARKRSIAVSAFTQTFLTQKAFIKDFKDEYVQVSFDNSADSARYLDICNPEVQSLLFSFYQELTAYDLYGIELDIIRYPASNLYKYAESDAVLTDEQITDVGYTDYAMNDFLEKNGLSGDLRTLIKTSKSVRQAWIAYKKAALDGFVKRVCTYCQAQDPEIVMSAAVMPDPAHALDVYLQDYPLWLEKGYLSAIEPMNYTADDEAFESTMTSLLASVDGRLISMGFAPLIDGGTIADNAYQIALMQAHVLRGYTLFSSNNGFQNHDLTDNLKLVATRSILPTASKDDIVGASMKDLHDKLASFYSRVDPSITASSYAFLEDLTTFTDYEKAKETLQTFVASLQDERVRTQVAGAVERCEAFLY